MFGRRPVYLVPLSLYFCANVGIALQNSFVSLLLLRMLQSAGISGTFSVAYGVIADIATPAERGAFVAALSFGITTAPSFGPLLGGILAYGAGWRWIFWLLSIMSAIVLLLIVLTLPETARSVVGNGSIPPPKWSRPLIPKVMRPWKKESPDTSTIDYKKKGFPNPLKALVVLSRLDTAVTITAGGILYMIFCASVASLSTTLIDIYRLNELEAGLIYLPYGASCLVSTLLSGKLVDRDYRIVAKKYGLPIDKVAGDDLSGFPIEEARMRSIFAPTFLAMFSMVGYGWAVHHHAHLSIPLILQFTTGLGIQTCFNYNNTLLIGINHKAPATAQASFNLVRCIMAALATGVVQYMIDGIGFGWSFTVFGGPAFISASLYFVEMKWGIRWRVGKRTETSEE
ncbi:chloramphenicol resistance protein, partial [Cadophora sp. DSE1049]